MEIFQFQAASGATRFVRRASVVLGVATVLLVGRSIPAFASGGGVSASPASTANVVPTLTCVSAESSGGFTAYFGYSNSGKAVTYPDGSSNFVTPSSLDGAQPTKFISGTVTNAFSVAVPSATTVTWTVAGQSVSAQSTSSACAGSTLSQDPFGMSLVLAIGGGSVIGAVVIRRATKVRSRS